MNPVVVQRIRMHPLVIRLRRTVSSASSERTIADPVIVSVELSNGAVGFGEAAPAYYVTGESSESVVATINDVFAPALVHLRADGFADALAKVEDLPLRDGDGRLIPSARGAIELALLDALLRTYDRSIDDVVRWMGLVGFGRPGSTGRVRFSGVLNATDADRTVSLLRFMRRRGICDFKLMVGMADDERRIASVFRRLRRAIGRDKASLRIDASGAWTKDDAVDFLTRFAETPLEAVEQPLARGSENDLPGLRETIGIGIMHDESLITLADAERLIGLGVADGFNIRLGKCGGMMPALRLAGLARRTGVRVQLGCVQGETSVLAAAGLRFLEVCPDVVWAEGCVGRSLLRRDVSRKSLRTRFGGRLPRLEDRGLCVPVDGNLLDELRQGEAITLNL